MLMGMSWQELLMRGMRTALIIVVLMILWALLRRVLSAIDQWLHKKKGEASPERRNTAFGTDLFAFLMIAAIAWLTWKVFHWNS